MSLYMMNTDKWFLCRICDSFRCTDTDKQSSDKSRTICNTYGIYIIKCYICILKCLLYNLIYLFNMLSRCNFRYNTAIQSMYRYLRRNHI